MASTAEARITARTVRPSAGESIAGRGDRCRRRGARRGGWTSAGSCAPADRAAAQLLLSRAVTGSVNVTRSGWLLLRAWNDGPQPEVLDNYPYGTTSPVYVQVADRVRRSREAATYFLRWLDRIQAATEKDSSYRTAVERADVLQDVARARGFYEQCLRDAK